jgi:arylsulfatase A-like enzyme
MHLFRILPLIASLWLPPAMHAAISAKPNVLFIVVDDLNDWVGFLGGHPQTRTPNMDRLAARGVVFANASCAAPLCAPSRSAVFSGREPYHSGAYVAGDNPRRVAPDLVLLPQHLRSQGYRVLGTGKLLHYERPELFDEWFLPEQRWSPFEAKKVNYTPEELPSKATSNPRHVAELPGGRSAILPLNRMPSDRRPKDPAAESFDWGPVDVPDREMGDVKVAEWALAHLRAPTENPFFLGVGFHRPHIPLFVPPRYFEPFPVDAMVMPPYAANDLNDVPPLGRQIALDTGTGGTHAGVVRHGQWKAAIAAYLACVYFVDVQIGRLLDALDAGPHADNTMVVLFGDNGWQLGEKDHWGKWTGWERSVRIPLLVIPARRDRAQFAVGQTSRQPVTLTDLYPTLLEYCQLPPPASKLDGQSLLPLLRAPDTRTGRVVVSTIDGVHFSVRDDRWRYIRYRDGSEELYDLTVDANEWSNLAAVPDHAGTKARLAAHLPRNPVRPAARRNAAEP